MDYKTELEYYEKLLNGLMEYADECRKKHATENVLASYYNGIVTGIQIAIRNLPREE